MRRIAFQGRLAWFAWLAWLGLASPAAAQEVGPSLHALFQDHMVLQRDAEVPVWGRAEPGRRVTVAIAGQSVAAEVGADGRWRARLKPLPAGGPHALTASSGPRAVTIRDVLVGDVWLCSGQSNMQFTLESLRDPGDNEAIAAADHPGLRFLDLFPGNGDNGSEAPLDDLTVTRGRWEVCTPEVAEGLSATAYFFGRALHKHLGVPIGVIVPALSGSPIEAWMSRAALRNVPEYARDGTLQFDWDPRKLPVPHWYLPIVRYNSLIHPIAPFALKGFVWYQGETNAMWGKGRRYRRLLPLLIEDWRAAWGGAPIPFIVVQLPNTDAPHDPARPFGRSPWSEVREAQRMATATAPATALAVTIDLGDRDLHPNNKEGIGGRIALAARGLAYGEAVSGSGPSFQRLDIEGPALRLRFDPAGGGLASADGGPLRHFQVAGADRRFHPAAARIEGETVVVSSPGVPAPVAVRYAWAENPEGVNFVDRAGRPASPFRSDDWEDAAE